MTRPEAIEAAARAERNHAVVTCAEQGVDLPPWGKLPERVRDSYREEAERCLDVATPHIESALLDRMLSENAVQAAAKAWFIAESGTEGMWDRLGPKAKNAHYRLARAALAAAVAAALSDIREEGGEKRGRPARRPLMKPELDKAVEATKLAAADRLAEAVEKLDSKIEGWAMRFPGDSETLSAGAALTSVRDALAAYREGDRP